MNIKEIIGNLYDMRRKKHEKWGWSGEKWRLSYVFAIFAHERLPNYHADFTIRLAVNSSK